MARRRKQRSKSQAAASEHAKDLETIRSVTDALAEDPVDLAQLRKLAAVRGLVNHQLRRRVWPLLLGIDLNNVQLDAEYQQHAAGSHRDTQVVKVDVERSLWAFTAGWSDAARATKRDELRRVLTAVSVASGGRCSYYQGLHDVASVLLFVGDERFAFALLQHLTSCQLRDCTRTTLDAVLEQLPLILLILHKADAELAQCIWKAGVLPYFALSWYITWFAHSVPELPRIARLYDLFMASHPLMPLYVGAIAMQAARDELLAVSADAAELHSALSKLAVAQHLTPDQLAQGAVKLFRQCPPDRLTRAFDLQWSVAPAARLQDGHWQVPDQPPRPGPLSRKRWLRGGGRKRQWAAAAIVSASTFAAVVGAALLMQLQSGSVQEYLLHLHHHY